MLADICDRSPKLQLCRDKLLEDLRGSMEEEVGRDVLLCWISGVAVRMRKLVFSTDVSMSAVNDRLARMEAARGNE